MKRTSSVFCALYVFPQPAAAKDVVMAPADYQMYSAYAARARQTVHGIDLGQRASGFAHQAARK